MRRITSRFVLLIATAAVLPLVIFGWVSISSLRSGTETSVREGNGKVARQAAEQIGMYMQHNIRVLQSIGAELGATNLERWRQDRILTDSFLAYPEFREITIFDRSGAVVATSAVGTTRLGLVRTGAKKTGTSPHRAAELDDEASPRRQNLRCTSVSPAGFFGWIVGEYHCPSAVAHGRPDSRLKVVRTCAHRQRRGSADRNTGITTRGTASRTPT